MGASRHLVVHSSAVAYAHDGTLTDPGAVTRHAGRQANRLAAHLVVHEVLFSLVSLLFLSHGGPNIRVNDVCSFDSLLCSTTTDLKHCAFQRGSMSVREHGHQSTTKTSRCRSRPQQDGSWRLLVNQLPWSVQLDQDVALSTMLRGDGVVSFPAATTTHHRIVGNSDG